MIDEALKKRLITAGLLIVFVLLVGWLGEPWVYATLACVAVGLCAIEFGGICVSADTWGLKRIAYSVLAALPALVCFNLLSFLSTETDAVRFSVASVEGLERQLLWNHPVFIGLISVAAGMLVGGIASIGYVVVVGGAHSLERSRRIAGDLAVGVFLIGGCGATLVALAMAPSSHWLLLWLFLVVCFNDTAAYFGGKKIGGPKLSRLISPNKTISGSVSGMLVGMIVGVISSRLVACGAPTGPVALLAIVVVIAAQLGDLAKSYVKRVYEVKDSGSFLPGHGGFLDRTDGILMGAPVLYLWFVAVC